ncbi:MAG: hypothetical protein AAGJ70_02135, partial [Pseudomonadota bacterium]
MSGDEATLTPVSLSPAKIAAYADASYVVLRSYPGSPAHALSIAKGWRLLRIDGVKPNDISVENARRGARFPLLLADATLQHAFELQSGAWPFGLVLAAWPGARFKRHMSIGDFDHEHIFKLWAE